MLHIEKKEEAMFTFQHWKNAFILGAIHSSIEKIFLAKAFQQEILK